MDAGASSIDAHQDFKRENRFEDVPQSPVPEGHATIAQRFNVGVDRPEISSPEGTAEAVRCPSAVPSGLTTIYLVLPMLKQWAIVTIPPGRGTNLSGVGAQALGLTSPRLWLIKQCPTARLLVNPIEL